MVTTRTDAWDVAADTPDPELPMVTVADLGILRDVTVDGERVVATITPTYSGCPAMREISADVRRRLERAGYAHVEILVGLAPAWTTDWITADGRRKLAEAGIAAPTGTRAASGPIPLTLGPTTSVPCPRCGSTDTRRSADFGATACKALHRCLACDEPFEAVKTI